MDENKFGSGGGVLEITLDAGPDVDDIARPPERISHEYVQRTIKGIMRMFVLFDDIYMNYSLNISNPVAFKLKFFRSKDIENHNVNLTYLDAKPDRIVHVAWKWFISALAAIAWGFVIIYVGGYTEFPVARDAMFPVGTILVTFGIIGFILFYYKSQDKVIYKSLVGQVPVIELFHMPKSAAYNRFIDLFEANIQQAKCRKGITMQHRLIGELKYLRKLKEAGLLAETDYEKARSRILSHDEYKV